MIVFILRVTRGDSQGFVLVALLEFSTKWVDKTETDRPNRVDTACQSFSVQLLETITFPKKVEVTFN